MMHLCKFTALLASLTGVLAAHPHDNTVNFPGADSVTFKLNKVSITNGQPFNGISGGQGNLDVKAGRKGSTNVAADFKEGISVLNAYGLKVGAPWTTFPSKLNFAIFGDITFSIDGKFVTCHDFRLGQGHSMTLGNNWWVGSRNCIGVPLSHQMVCNCGGGLNKVYVSAGGDDHTYNVRMDFSVGLSTITTLVDKDQNKCLDLTGGDHSNGNKLQIWDCNGSVNQQWIFYGFYPAIFGIVSAKDTSKCVDAGDMSNGQVLKIWDCNGLQQQKFGYDCIFPGTKTLVLASSMDMAKPGNRTRLSSPLASKCADLAGGVDMDGTAAQVWHCNGLVNQKWGIYPVKSQVTRAEGKVDLTNPSRHGVQVTLV